eukprot:CAMPEP_0170934592 /NCGR_PEP_ID=MMETSP0735-20130129/18462_1 /TAXON_ID=186038 /ORGANISM="Fragilariopsis kerguelensis, Strain L26-C5" /LENGTH=257 /DNA_ID=CAMNT_0011337875 /DNA_START=156 /DNA_END=929 /DNA_ORIENTATION=+
MFPMKLFSLGVIIAYVITPIVVVDAFSSSGVVNQRTQTQTRTQSRTGRQPSQQPSSSSMLPPLAYLVRDGDDAEFGNGSNSNNNNNHDKSTKKRATLSITSIIPTSTGITATVGTINLNNNVEEKMIEDLQNQHGQMRQMQQQVHHQVQHQTTSLYSVATPPVSYAVSSSTSPMTATATAIPSSMTLMSSTITAAATRTMHNDVTSLAGMYDQLHDDLTYMNIQLLRSKLAFLHRLLPNNKKQMIDRFVNFLIQFIL